MSALVTNSNLHESNRNLCKKMYIYIYVLDCMYFLFIKITFILNFSPPLTSLKQFFRAT